MTRYDRRAAEKRLEALIRLHGVAHPLVAEAERVHDARVDAQRAEDFADHDEDY